MNQEIELVEMKRAEFEVAASFSFEHYIIELSQSAGKTISETREKVTSDSWTNTDHDLWFNIVLNDLKIGYLWLEVEGDKSEAFICDIHIFNQFRGKSYGRHSILKTKDFLLNIGVHTIGLCVFGSNLPARGLYLSMDFKDKSFSEKNNRYEMFLEL
jgi:ribosomal protein S18 acetylase RimI-like enzyme